MITLSTDGTACEITNDATGELFVAVSLVTWEHLTALAEATAPCRGCGAPGCRLAVLVLDTDQERGSRTACEG